MLALLQSLLSFGTNILSIIFSLGIAVIIGFTMMSKGRNGLLWGIAGFFFPWIILITFMIPAKQPKLHSSIRNHPAFKGKNPVVGSIMALSAMVAKSDGRVTKEEVQLVRNFVQRQFRVNPEDLNGYEAAFNYGKEHPEDYEVFTNLLRQYRRYNIVTAVSYLFVGMAMHDSEMSTEEENLLRKITNGLGLHEYEYQSIKQHYASGGRQQSGYQQYGGFQGGFGGFQQGYQRSYQQAGPSRVDKTKKYSDVLGVPVDADMSTIKKAYRKLAKENHPDKMAQDGMPESYIKFANERISEINEAYDWLKETKMATA